MSPTYPRVTVVIATRNRPDRLTAVLESLRAQTLDADQFDVIVVDDASDDPRVGAVLAEAAGNAAPRLTTLVQATPGGQSAGRNRGWQCATGELVAFTDDDCVMTPGWLAAGLDAWNGEPQRFVQGMTKPMPSELDRMSVFAHTIIVGQQSAEFETCNMFYPREMLARLGGFDAVNHARSGEDTDLGWRAIEAGATPVFAPDALAYHAVIELDPSALLKRAWNFSDAIIPYGKHPELRRTRLIGGLFWKWTHYLYMRALIGVLLARLVPRAWPLSVWLVLPLLRFHTISAREKGGGVRHLPWLLTYDTVEIAAVIRGAARGRTIVL